MAALEAARVPCGVVLSPADLADDPHAAEIGLLVDDVHPIAGAIRQPRHPALFGATLPVGPRPRSASSNEILASFGLTRGHRSPPGRGSRAVTNW
jgi:crotonobetainyl-CoA:carnitine CoA-transferase CaiB-like acyl-CoA transferase